MAPWELARESLHYVVASIQYWLRLGLYKRSSESNKEYRSSQFAGAIVTRINVRNKLAHRRPH